MIQSILFLSTVGIPHTSSCQAVVCLANPWKFPRVEIAQPLSVTCSRAGVPLSWVFPTMQLEPSHGTSWLLLLVILSTTKWQSSAPLPLLFPLQLLWAVAKITPQAPLHQTNPSNSAGVLDPLLSWQLSAGLSPAPSESSCNRVVWNWGHTAGFMNPASPVPSKSG